MIVSLRKLRGRLAAARVSSNTGHTVHPPDISSAGALDAARRTLHIRCGHDIMVDAVYTEARAIAFSPTKQ